MFHSIVSNLHESFMLNVMEFVGFYSANRLFEPLVKSHIGSLILAKLAKSGVCVKKFSP